MTKEKFIELIMALYRVGNRSDSDDPTRETWTKPAMAAEATCQPLDSMLNALVKAGVITSDECQAIYDNL